MFYGISVLLRTACRSLDGRFSSLPRRIIGLCPAVAVVSGRRKIHGRMLTRAIRDAGGSYSARSLDSTLEALNESCLSSQHRDLDPAIDVEFRHDFCDLSLDCSFADMQRQGNLGVSLAGRECLENGPVPAGEALY